MPLNKVKLLANKELRLSFFRLCCNEKLDKKTAKISNNKFSEKFKVSKTTKIKFSHM